MSKGDYIQIGILLVLSGTLIVVLWQIIFQNRLLKAQLLRDRFEMYWKTYNPISDDQIREFQVIPGDYINQEKYEKDYKGNEEAIRKYLIYLQLYEYLGFVYTQKKLKLLDPLGYGWTEKWIKDLIKNKEFVDVHEYHKRFYEEYGEVVDKYLP